MNREDQKKYLESKDNLDYARDIMDMLLDKTLTIDSIRLLRSLIRNVTDPTCIGFMAISAFWEDGKYDYGLITTNPMEVHGLIDAASKLVSRELLRNEMELGEEDD